jgi:hypothetical protein
MSSNVHTVSAVMLLNLYCTSNADYASASTLCIMTARSNVGKNKKRRARTRCKWAAQWVARGLIEGTGATAGELHALVRAYTEVVRLKMDSTSTMEHFDEHAGVAKSCRIKFLAQYRALFKQRYPFDSVTARAVKIDDLLKKSVPLGDNGNEYTLRTDVVTTSSQDSNRVNTLGELKSYMSSTEWRVWDTDFSGPMSVKRAD